MYLMISLSNDHHWGLRYFAGNTNLSSKSIGKGSKNCLHLVLFISPHLNHFSTVCGKFYALATNSSEITNHKSPICATFSLKDRENRRVSSTLCPSKLLKKPPHPILSINNATFGSMSSNSLPVGLNLHKGSIVAILSRPSRYG